MQLHKKQREIVKSNKRFRVVNAGRRGGKTVLAVEELIFNAAINTRGNIAYVAPTHDQARDICWEMLLRRLEGIKDKKVNETRLEVTIPNKFGDTSKIALRSWESIESFRGKAFHFLVMDEVAMYRNFDTSWKEIVRPTLTDYIGGVLFISTPKGFNHWYDLCNNEKTNDNYKTFHFTSYDNPYVSAEEIDEAKKELDEDSFAQEYLGDFRKISGLVCKWFDRDIHVQEAGEITDWYEVIDGGYADPLAYLLIGVTETAIYVVDGFRKEGLLTGEIREMRDAIVGDRILIEGWADNDNPRLLDELDLDLAPVEKLPNESKTWDETLAQKMDEYGRVVEELSGIYIDPKLDWLIQEIESLTWLEKTGGEKLPKWNAHRLFKHHYDGIRALAYFLISFSRECGGIVYWEGKDFIEKMSEKDEGMYDADEVLERKRNPFKS